MRSRNLKSVLSPGEEAGNAHSSDCTLAAPTRYTTGMGRQELVPSLQVSWKNDMLVARIAFLFGLLIVGGIFYLLYFMAASFVTVFLLGLSGDVLYFVQYVLCIIAGFATAIYLMRGGWPKAKPPKPPVEST